MDYNQLWTTTFSIVVADSFIMLLSFTRLFVLVLSLFQVVNSGPVTGALCYTACNAGYGACLGLVGVTAGVTAPVTWAGWWYGVPAACVGCSVAQGTCMAACTPLFIAPSP